MSRGQRLRTVIALALAACAGWAQALEPAALAPLDAIVQGEIRAGRIPGAVVLVGQGEHILYRKAFGLKSVHPAPEPMQPDTVFDLASLTKAVATTTAVLQLAERGLLELDAPAARYWPAFGTRGKQAITVRQLLSHSSGLPAGLDPGRARDPIALHNRIALVAPKSAPGLGVRYSDVNFAALGEIVGRVSGQRLDLYAERHIFRPLGMEHTRFNPPPTWRERIAPTSPDARGQMRQGRVHDPLAAAMGGIAGHAGLFGSADDLARFARDLLAARGKLLQPASVRAMLGPQTLPGAPLRGLGWRLDPPLAANRAALPALGAASHYGFTGTALWLDPATGTYMVALSSRLHPDERGDAGPLRARLAAALSEAIGPLPPGELARQRPEWAARLAPYTPRPVAQALLTGIDVLRPASSSRCAASASPCSPTEAAWTGAAGAASTCCTAPRASSWCACSAPSTASPRTARAASPTAATSPPACPSSACTANTKRHRPPGWTDSTPWWWTCRTSARASTPTPPPSPT